MALHSQLRLTRLTRAPHTSLADLAVRVGRRIGKPDGFRPRTLERYESGDRTPDVHILVVLMDEIGASDQDWLDLRLAARANDHDDPGTADNAVAGPVDNNVPRGA